MTSCARALDPKMRLTSTTPLVAGCRIQESWRAPPDPRTVLGGSDTFVRFFESAEGTSSIHACFRLNHNWLTRRPTDLTTASTATSRRTWKLPSSRQTEIKVEGLTSTSSPPCKSCEMNRVCKRVPTLTPPPHPLLAHAIRSLWCSWQIRKGEER